MGSAPPGAAVGRRPGHRLLDWGLGSSLSQNRTKSSWANLASWWVPGTNKQEDKAELSRRETGGRARTPPRDLAGAGCGGAPGGSGPRGTRLCALWQVPLSQLAYGPSSPPQTLYNPAQQILAYAGFCQAPPASAPCSSFPLPLQVGGRPGPGHPGSVGWMGRGSGAGAEGRCWGTCGFAPHFSGGVEEPVWTSWGVGRSEGAWRRRRLTAPGTWGALCPAGPGDAARCVLVSSRSSNF